MGPIWNNLTLQVDAFAFDLNLGSFDPVKQLANVTVDGEFSAKIGTSEIRTNEAVESVTGTFNYHTRVLELLFTTENETVWVELRLNAYPGSEPVFSESAVAMDDLGTTIVVAPDRVGPRDSDVWIVSKDDNCESFSDENVTITSVGAALDDAGIPRPFSSLPAYIRHLPIPGVPGATTQNLFADNPEHVGRVLENDYAYLEWTAQGELAVRSVEDGETFWSSGTNAADAKLAWQPDGHLVIYSGGSPIWASYTHGAPQGHTLRLIGTQAVILSESGIVRWSTPAAMSVPARGPASQSVKITPDGRTIAVQQVTEAGLRIDVLDRAAPGSPWVATGSFPIEGSDSESLSTELPTNAFALGSDAPPFELPGDFCWAPDPRPYTPRFLAYPSDLSGNTITIRSQGSAGQPWIEVAELPGHNGVASMAFDHWSDNLAIGEPGKQKVSVYTRPNWWDTSGWDLTKELQPNAEPDFGAKVDYTFGVLGVSDREAVRFYRRADTTSDPEWQDFSDWATFIPRGEGSDARHVAFSLAGDSATVITGTASLQHQRDIWFEDLSIFDDIDNFRR